MRGDACHSDACGILFGPPNGVAAGLALPYVLPFFVPMVRMLTSSGRARFVYLLRMTEDEVVLALRAFRKLRRGTMQPAVAPTFLRPVLGHGLGPACDEFAAWVRRSASDPRAADAAIRFFGLDRLPEGLQQVCAALAPLQGTGRPGIGPRQVEKLVRRVVSDMAGRGDSTGGMPTEMAAPQSWRDPFPLPHDPALRRWVAQVLRWGWAQVAAGDGVATAALLHYEYEHAMRASAPKPSSRVERIRWRQLAWSVLEVARHRATRAASIARPDLAGGHAGAAPDLAESALDLVRTAVREGRHEAPELLRLLQEGTARCRATVGSVPQTLEAKLVALAAIMAREGRDPAGISAARAGLQRIVELLNCPSAARDHETWVRLVEDGYRTSQELADLYLSLGKAADARVAASIMRSLLQRFGDPDPETLPEGWHWNLYVTEASVNRHLALAAASPRNWHQAAAIAARRAAELAATAILPAPWALAAENEIIAVALDRLTVPSYRASKEGRRLLDDVAWRLRQLDIRSQQILDQRDRATRSAVLQAKLLRWRLALIQADPAAIRIARATVMRAARSAAAPILPIEADVISRYAAASSSRVPGSRHDPTTR